MQKKTVLGAAGFVVVAGLLAAAAYGINRMTDSVSETVENDSIFVFEKKKDLPEGLVEPFAAEGEEAKVSPALWKVTDSDGSYIYMLGSIHMLTLNDYPLPRELGKAYDECGYVAVEIYNVDASRSLDDEKIVYTESSLDKGDSIDKHLTAEQYTLLKSQLKELGMDENSCDGYAPWYAYQTLSVVPREDFAPDEPSDFYGIDTIFQILGNRDEKEVLSVENHQIKHDANAKLDDETAGLLIKLRGLGMENSYPELYAAWSSGDYEKCYDLIVEFNGETDEERAAWERYVKLTLDDRNRHMADVAEEYLEKDMNVFYVVGTAHYGGEKGLLSLLEKDGYTIERIN